MASSACGAQVSCPGLQFADLLHRRQRPQRFDVPAKIARCPPCHAISLEYARSSQGFAVDSNTAQRIPETPAACSWRRAGLPPQSPAPLSGGPDLLGRLAISRRRKLVLPGVKIPKAPYGLLSKSPHLPPSPSIALSLACNDALGRGGVGRRGLLWPMPCCPSPATI